MTKTKAASDTEMEVSRMMNEGAQQLQFVNVNFFLYFTYKILGINTENKLKITNKVPFPFFELCRISQ